jgi:DNA-binding IclR family transcriptional regulator
MKQDRQFVTSLARGLKVLRCFTAQRNELGTTEIAQMIGLPQPTVWRLCHTLVSLGYLVPTAGRDKLRVGAPVLSLGYAALAELDYIQVIRPHLQQLADRFKAAVAIAERHQLSMIYLERCQGESILLMNLHIGSRIPIYNSAIGWAYLAGLGAEDRATLLEELRRAAGKTWPVHKARVEDALSHYEKHGFIINCGIQHPDVSAVAIPVGANADTPLLSLNCGGARSVLTEDILLKEVGPALVELGHLLETGSRGSARSASAQKRMTALS